MNVRLLLLALLAIPSASAAGVEQRCTDLGANCACSETLDTTSFTSGLIGTDSWINPSNSTTKECGASGKFLGGNLFGTEIATRLSIIDETAMPAGNTVSKVWQFNYPSNRNGNGSDAAGSFTSSTRRVCNRFYYRWTSDANDFPDCNNKIMDFTFGGDVNAEIQIRDNADNGMETDVKWTTPSTIPNPGSFLAGDVNDCKGNWCRVEQCVMGNLTAGTNITAQWYWTQVGVANPKHYESPVVQPGQAPGGINAPENQRAMFLFRSTGAGSVPGTGPCTGSRSFSHFMEATWNTAAGQTIGKAYEIEGGATAPPPPSGGTTTAPPPPILLP